MDNNKKKVKAHTQSFMFNELVSYAVEEIIKPKCKEILSYSFNSMITMGSDVLTKSIDKVIYPEGSPRKTNKSGSGTYQSNTNYTVYSRSNSEKPKRESVNSRSSVDVKYVWVDSKEDAEKLVGTLKEEIEMYGKAKVATLYENLEPKVTTNFADYKFGWTDADSIGYYQDGKRWFIDLPKPVNIENIN